MPIISRFQQCH